MSFKKFYIKERVGDRYKAYWLSPSGITIPVTSTHIDEILKEPKRFGITQKYIDDIASKMGGKHELRDGGKARDEIMTSLLNDGWKMIFRIGIA